MNDYKLTEYTVPQTWYDAHFIGNGRMGAALMCGIAEDTIYLNEETVWGSKAGGKANPKMPENLRRSASFFSMANRQKQKHSREKALPTATRESVLMNLPESFLFLFTKATKSEITKMSLI